jgi:membrane protein YdbS with pleckstrin-like domain
MRRRVGDQELHDQRTVEIAFVLLTSVAAGLVVLAAAALLGRLPVLDSSPVWHAVWDVLLVGVGVAVVVSVVYRLLRFERHRGGGER